MTQTICSGGCEKYEVATIVVGSILATIVVILYCKLVIAHKAVMTSPDVEILNLRMAAILPLYSLLYLLGIIIPQWWDFIEFAVSFVEGYCILCFFMMIAHEVGSEDEMKRLITDADVAAPCFYHCQKSTPVGCYKTMRLLLIQFMSVRPALFLAIAILEYKEAPHRILVILAVLTVISIIVAMIALIRSYNIFVKPMSHLFPSRKILFVKLIIILVIIENNIVNQYQNSGPFESGDPIEQHNFDKARQIYCTLCIIEFFIFSLFMSRIFQLDTETKSEYGGKRAMPMWKFALSLLSLWTVIFMPIGNVHHNVGSGGVTTPAQSFDGVNGESVQLVSSSKTPNDLEDNK